uniref:REP element-mobilizing transposase RayT n=1 Tax=Candidatus Kentrum sp. DK TaxID=2126562 RepID=A0A450SPW7_9GAMM|nr:MAG: REP element-mobilizing transposase RayT [Candidatus Kentron sp. DK]VFJ60107.1 MAG: REP element-mobilizing transposase RayT [Candidatus Kentron sp. DK]
MPQSLSSLHVHLIFSTKNREPFLENTEIRDEMHTFLGGIAKKLECPPIIVGGMEDHVHLLCLLGRTVSLADCVKELKRVSSIWIKQRGPALTPFAWQNGYGAFSVSASSVGDVREYIAKQEEHHKRRSFQDEYRALLRKHGLVWDERYVWE